MFSKFSLTTLTLSTSLASFCFAGPFDSEYDAAILASPHLARLHEDGVARRMHEQRELGILHAFVQEHAPAYEGDLRAEVSAALAADGAYFTDLVNKLRGVDIGATTGLKFQVRDSKVHLGAQKALALLESSFDGIISGTLPAGFSIETPRINTADDREHIYSSGRGLALKYLLTRTAMVLSGTTSVNSLFTTLRLNKAESPWIQTTPLPKNFASLEMGESPYVQDGSTLDVIHNGYTFGGHRDFPDHPFPAHDCSTIVGDYVGELGTFTTWHQVTQFQLHHGLVHDTPEIVAEWEKVEPGFRTHDEFVAMDARMAPMKVFDMSRVSPGDIYAFKRFPSPSLYGGGGHTGFVLGFQGKGPDAQVITVSASRDLERTDKEFSFGVEPFPAFDDLRETGKLTMYFNVNGGEGPSV